MRAKSVSKARDGRISKNRWAGRAAKRFGHAANWSALYAVWGTFLFSASAAAMIAGVVSAGSVKSSQILPVFVLFLSVLLIEQIALMAATAFFVRAYSVWLGEAGTEICFWGFPKSRIAWGETARVDLRQTLWIRYARLFLIGRPYPVYVPVYGKEADAFFREASEWLGGKQVTEPNKQAVMPEAVPAASVAAVAVPPQEIVCRRQR